MIQEKEKELLIEPYSENNLTYITLKFEKDKVYRNIEQILIDNDYYTHCEFLSEFNDNVCKINTYKNTKYDHIFIVVLENSFTEICFNCDSLKDTVKCVKELSELMMNCLKSSKLILELSNQ